MMLDREGDVRSIPMEESLRVEFKSDRKTIAKDAILKEVVAMANTDGGNVYIGVEDDGEITGAQAVHRDRAKMQAFVSHNTVPPVYLRAELVDDDPSKPVMRLAVDRSSSVVSTLSGTMYRRRYKSDGKPEAVPMYAYEIVTRLSDLGRLDFSAQPVIDATLDDFDQVEMTRLKRDVEKYPGGDKSLLELSDFEIERALHLVKTENGVDTPTLTGLLLLGKEESLARLVPTHEAVFLAMQGTDNKANVTFRRPLLYTIDSMVDAIVPWNPVTEVEMGLFSEPVPAYDARAIREAVVNAFSHRDYSVLDRVRVQVDDAGLTIANPGGFVEGITINNLLTAEPHGRNNCLAAALKRIGLAESSGRGIDRIYEGSLLYGRPLPDYTASNDVRVNLFIARSEPDKAFVKMLANEHDRTGRPVSLQGLLVLDALKRERRATLADLERELDVDAPRLRHTLESLVEAGIIEAVGSSRSRAYVLGAGVYTSAGKGKEYVRQTDIDKLRYPELIMKLVDSQGKVTKSDVVSLLHIPEDAAYYEIRKLKKSGQLASAQKGRNAYYVRPDKRK